MLGSKFLFLGLGVTSICVLVCVNRSNPILSDPFFFLPSCVDCVNVTRGIGNASGRENVLSSVTSTENFLNINRKVTVSPSRYVAKFQMLVSGGDLDTLMRIMDAFTDAMKQANISFFLYSGSLVGSWRHHGLIPWDDDVDFVFSSALRPVAEQALRKLAPTFQLSTTQRVRWKLFSLHSLKIKNIPGVDWEWPFLDISFYDENSTHIWDMDKRFSDFVYKKSDVFPLTQRPFQGRLLLAPKNSSAVLRQTYNVDMCETNMFDHRVELLTIAETRATVKCDRLHHLFPFVVRKPSPREGGGYIETLQKNGTTISCCFVVYN